MANVQTVAISRNPPSIGEFIHKIAKLDTDGIVEMLFPCELCKRLVLTSASLKDHRRQQTEPVQCEQYNQKFA